MDYIQKTQIQMRYGDLDGLNHVNNATYLTYFELGRINYFREFLGGFFSRKVNFVVNHADIDFKKPIHFEDNPVMFTWISSIGNSSCVFSHEIRNESDLIFARGKTVIVWIDENKQKMKIDEDIRMRLEELLIKDDQ